MPYDYTAAFRNALAGYDQVSNRGAELAQARQQEQQRMEALKMQEEYKRALIAQAQFEQEQLRAKAEQEAQSRNALAQVARGRDVSWDEVMAGPMPQGQQPPVIGNIPYSYEESVRMLAPAIGEKEFLSAIKPQEVDYDIKEDASGNYVYMPKRPGAAVFSGVRAPEKKSLVDMRGANFGTQIPIEKGTKSKVEDQMIETMGLHSLVKSGIANFKPEYQQLGTKFGQSWATLKDKIGGLPPADQKSLDEYTNYRATFGQLTAERMKSMAGSAVTPSEMARQLTYLPNVGDSPFDGDSPTQLYRKATRLDDFYTKVNARLSYIRANGMELNERTLAQTPLDKMPTIIKNRGNALAAEFKRQNPQASDADIRREVSAKLAQEFGVMQ